MSVRIRLRSVAERTQSWVKFQKIEARKGGGVDIVVLEHTTKTRAESIGERLRKVVVELFPEYDVQHSKSIEGSAPAERRDLADFRITISIMPRKAEDVKKEKVMHAGQMPELP